MILKYFPPSPELENDQILATRLANGPHRVLRQLKSGPEDGGTIACGALNLWAWLNQKDLGIGQARAWPRTTDLAGNNPVERHKSCLWFRAPCAP